MVLVDSSIWIEAARRQGKLEAKVGLETLLQEYEAGLCSPVRLEVLGGARPSDRARLNHFFKCLPCLEVSETAWQEAIQLAWKMVDRGYPIPWNDLLVGTLALQNRCRVYAMDKHFELLSEHAGVRLYHPGYGGSFNPE